jgi:hypothetical protein
MQRSNRKLSAARDHNNYSLVSSIDALLEEDSKEEPLGNSNVNNNNNHSSAPTISIIKGEDKRTPPRVLNIIP